MKERILEELSKFKGKGHEEDIVSMNLVSDIIFDQGKVIFSINVPAGLEDEFRDMREEVEKQVSKIDGVDTVLIALTAEQDPQPALPPVMPESKKGQPAGPDMRPTPSGVPGVKSIIAVASGKGGVGKSTTTVNLALGLRALGMKIGLLDADIYGPSLPRLLAIQERPEIRDGKIIPIDRYGVKVISMGLMMDEESPVIWRGPMVVSALMQMVREVEWGDLDILILDMPPGTGDAQLTMAQQVRLAGAVIVSTPQDLALVDARKGLKMFQQVNVPIMGLIENMSMFVCPHCGKDTDIFGHGGAQEEAMRLHVTFLGAVPLHRNIRLNSDQGTPAVVSDPDGPHAEIYKSIALKIAAQLSVDE